MALIGNLKELNLVNLIQLNCIEKKTAKLTFNYRGKIGVIYFDNGEIPHAQFDNISGPDAIYRAIHLPEGEFKIEEGIRTNIRTNDIKWSELILEGMRIYDESQIGQDQIFTDFIKKMEQIDRSIIAVILLSKDGQPKANTDLQENELKLYCAMLAFAAGKIQNMGRQSGIGYFKDATILFSDKIVLIYDRDPDIIGVFTNPQANLKMLEPVIAKEIQNYTNERR
ncbi:MAG: DUF4388 domain-containing protein [Acidobacteria bacterium]|nr:DUF4388 domain-containing protein [Acidobacteriota bacterium]